MISFWIVCQTENVIHRDIVKLRKLNQNIRRDISLTKLVIAVNLLGTT